MRRPSKDEEEFLRLITEIRILEGGARELQVRLGIVNATLAELKSSSETLKGIKGKEKDAQIFVPIGGGSFVKAKVDDIEKVIVGIGAGVALEKKIADALDSTEIRIAELEKIRMELERQLASVLAKLEEDRARLGELTRKLREETIARPSQERNP